ncbi:hypothetical protein ACFVXE_31440 [Streptomyces sp. NPDC058231]|uniref:hypothetical protein n=1 Tax=Streptomyces sp. NPDC058231 TaxID=3346392 RepID=UPI0036E4F8A1
MYTAFLTQWHLDLDEFHNREWSRIPGELLACDADRYPALTRAIACAFAPDDTGPLAFVLDRILNDGQSLIYRTECFIDGHS